METTFASLAVALVLSVALAAAVHYISFWL